MTDAATAYAIGVTEGRIPAGPYVLGACRRHVRELARQADEDFPFIFDSEPLERFRKFCRILKQYKGEFAGLPLELLPWQCFIIGSLLGWKHKVTGLRRYRTGYVEIPRKNGKSALASAFALWCLMLDGEKGAEVYTLGTKRDQARIVYDDALRFLPLSLRQRHLVERTTGTTHPASESVMRALASDSKKLDGLNPSAFVGDELHEWKSRDLWDVVENGTGARLQPLGLGITTAGHNKRGIAWQLHTACAALADDAGERRFVLDSMFGYIAAPSGEDARLWWEPRVWAIANPCLGAAKRPAYMEEQAARAAAIPSSLDQFLNKQLNVWTEAARRWLPAKLWDAGRREYHADELVGLPCFGALDLARVSDLSSFALVFPPHGERTEWRSLAWHWCPEEAASKRTVHDKVPYQSWADQGLITLTDGAATDFERVAADILTLCRIYTPGAVAFDRMFASATVQQLQAEGVPMLEHGQGFASMGPPTSELERLLVAGMWTHQGKGLMDWQAGNVVTPSDAAGNLKPDKSKSVEKIDGIVATIMALGAEMSQRAVTGEVSFWA